jgi:hypothetical protein
MIDYATWCAIRDGAEKHLSAAQLAAALNLDVKTVRRWIGQPYAQRQAAKRDSKLDPFKARIVRWLESHPLSARAKSFSACATRATAAASVSSRTTSAPFVPARAKPS